MQPSPTKSGYLAFLLAEKRFLAFGFTMAFISSAGQTFFIGTFGPQIRHTFDLSHGSWGTIYMIGTLLSAAVLPWTGQLFDKTSLQRYTAFVCLGLIVASAFMAFVPSALFLVLAIFLLRQTGQGLSSHTGSAAMAKGYHRNRGKAVAIASLGFSAGEAVLPILAVTVIAAYGWRTAYGSVALVLAIALPPLLWYLLQSPRAAAGASAGHDEAPLEQKEVRSWNRKEVLSHGVFYLLLPAVLTPPFIATALFFHHLPLAEAKGWSASWITGNYWIYALGAVAASLSSGHLIDRWTAVKVLPSFLIPMVVALAILTQGDAALWVLPYLLFLGLTSGLAYTVVTSLWAEVYGRNHLGAIRSLTFAFSVFASALGPPVMGLMMDAGISVEMISAFFIVHCLAASLLLLIGLRRLSQQRKPIATLD